MAGFLDQLTPDDVISATYIGYFDRAGDPEGFAFWANDFLIGTQQLGQSTDEALTAIADNFAPQPETLATFPFLATSGPLDPNNPVDVQGVHDLVTQVYENLFDRAPDASGLAYWSNQILTGLVPIGRAILLIMNGAQGVDQTVLLNKITVANFFVNELNLIGGTSFTPPSSVLLEEAHAVVQFVDATQESVQEAKDAITAFVAQDNLATIFTGPGKIFTLTQGQDDFHGFGADVFNAPLSAPQGGQLEGQPTLTDGDSIVEESPVVKGVSTVLNATFDGSWTAASLNIVGVPIWNIDNTGQSHHHEGGAVILTGDGPGGPNVISGLRELHYNADSGSASLFIGDNAEPVQEPGGANGFAIFVNDAVGNGENGVDVDIDASAFTGNDTIFVTATRVGGFHEENGSFVVPPPILVADNNADDYDPNWVGYLGNAFAIASGASAGPNGPVGFAHWDVTSNGAGAIGSLNILALGGEGSTSATSLTMHDDGSNTMVYATAISDSRSTDWENLNNVNLSDTSGFVTLTGAEVDVQEEIDLAFFDGKGNNNKDPFLFFGGGGLLTSVIGPITVIGGSGNSFYDFSGLDSSGTAFATVIAPSSFDGGHGTNGNSEIAFNNNVLTEDGAPGGGTTVVNLTNISILDDTGFPLFTPPLMPDGGSPWIAANSLWGQGGTINMANFPLTPTHVPYALIAEDLNPDGGLVPPATVPFGLPFTQVPNPLTPFVPVDGATLPSTISQDWANDFTNGVVPAGFEILQLLNGEGSTAARLESDLFILNGPNQFAINMQDVADGFRVDLASAATVQDAQKER